MRKTYKVIFSILLVLGLLVACGETKKATTAKIGVQVLKKVL